MKKARAKRRIGKRKAEKLQELRIIILLCFIAAFFILLGIYVSSLIWGSPKEHFRACIIQPIPSSVKSLKVATDGLIINPDVAYWFRFFISSHDLKKIIIARSLRNVSEIDVPNLSNEPSWWKVRKLPNPDIYVNHSLDEQKYIGLWWDASRAEAYYIFVRY